MMEAFAQQLTENIKAFIKRQILLFVAFLLKVLAPLIIIVIIAFLLFMVVAGATGALISNAEQPKAEAKKSTVTTATIDGNLKPQDKKVKVNDIDYPLPRINGLSETQFYALMALRVAEFGSDQDFELKGMEDSCSIYQQRLSELLPNQSLSGAARELLGNDKYNLVFTPEMIKWIQQNAWTARTYKIPKTSSYGGREVINTTEGSTPSFHDGLDFAHAMRTPVVASMSGVVHETNENGGKWVVLKHEGQKISPEIKSNDSYTVYLHLDSIRVKKGDKVVQGQQIAESGNTGMSTAPHLHYSIFSQWEGKFWNNSKYSVDPAKYFTNNLIFNEQPFFGACRVLQFEQASNGFFDRLQLKRFEIRATKLKDFTLTTGNIDEFLNILLVSHGARADTHTRWLNDAKRFLVAGRIANAYKTYQDAYK
jgi:murein DD-endopeptidase MepM/ murein hydrolase activator NlpD